MKTKKFISKLRAVIQIAALVVFALLMVWMIGDAYSSSVHSVLLRYWPIGAGVIFTYMVLSVAEDYLNNRIIYHYTKMK